MKSFNGNDQAPNVTWNRRISGSILHANFSSRFHSIALELSDFACNDFLKIYYIWHSFIASQHQCQKLGFYTFYHTVRINKLFLKKCYYFINIIKKKKGIERRIDRMRLVGVERSAIVFRQNETQKSKAIIPLT